MPKSLQSQKNTEKSNPVFFLIAVLLCVRHIFQLLGFSSIASTLFKFLYVFVFLFLAYCILQKLQLKQTSFSFLLFLAFLLLFIWIALKLLLVYRSQLESSITFLLAFPLLFSSRAIRPVSKDAKVFFYLLTAVAALLVVFAFIPSSYRDGMLLLYTQNENQSGLLYMSVFLGIFSFLCIEKKKNVFWWVLSIGLLYGAFRTGSRTAFSACILCMGLCLLLFLLPRWKKAVFSVAMLLFAILPFIVTWLVEKLGVDFTFMGSSAWTGREKIWPTVVETVLNEPFSMKIGQTIAHSLSEELGAHNTMLDIAWDFSLPTAVFFLIGLISTGRMLLNENKEKRLSCVPFACFIAGLLHMTMEASLITGALDYTLYFLLAIFCGKALLDSKTEDKKEGKNDEPAPDQHNRSRLQR